MNSNKEVTINLRDAKILGFSTVTIMCMLGLGSSYTSKIENDIESSMILIEDNKSAYKEYFKGIYPTLASRQIDLHIWEEFLEETDKCYNSLDDRVSISGTFNIANKERPFVDKYYSSNVQKQKRAEELVNAMRREVESSQVLTGKTRRVYNIEGNRFKELLREYKTFVECL